MFLVTAGRTSPVRRQRADHAVRHRRARRERERARRKRDATRVGSRDPAPGHRTQPRNGPSIDVARES